jgi:hypothetical protein
VRAADEARRLVRERAAAEPVRPEAERLCAALVAAGGESVRAVIFFGSQRSGAGSRNEWSAFDFFVLTDGYRRFYEGLRRAGALRRAPGLCAWLNTWLPPNQLSFRAPSGEAPGQAKCAVIDAASFVRETSMARRDHFCAGRLFQPAQVVYAADAAARELALDALASAHAVTLSWIRPWLPEAFDAAGYCRTLLRVSLSREIRPEPTGRADALFEAQRSELVPVYERLLAAYAAEGVLVPGAEPGSYRLAAPVDDAERRATVTYFRRSKVRATLRWSKYVITFEDWLQYIVRKAERHTGATIELTPRERRFPLVFLWPRIFRYLRDKDLKR